MGRLAQIAEDHYRRWLPKTYAGLSDPATFFAELEAEAENQILDLEDSLSGPDPVGETFMEKVGRLRQARRAAEAQVMRELVLPEPEADAPGMRQEPSPEDQELEEALEEFQQAVEEFHQASLDLDAAPRPSNEPTTPETPPKE